jgi:hypothetical protein
LHYYVYQSDTFRIKKRLALFSEECLIRFPHFKKSSAYLHQYFYQACLQNNQLMVDYLVDNYRIRDWDMGLWYSCQRGHIELASRMLKKTKEYNYGLDGACMGGHLLLAQLMVKHGGNDWSTALHQSCASGNEELVKYIMNKGYKKLKKNDWDNGLWKACGNGHLNLAELMGEQGATDWQRGLDYALEKNQNPLVIQAIKNKIMVR